MAATKEHIAPLQSPPETAHPALDPALEQVLLRIRLRARRRIAWLRKVWTEAGAGNGNGAGVHFEVDAFLSNQDAPAAEAAWYETAREVQALNEAIAQVEADMGQDEHSRPALLTRIFCLSGEEVNILHACLAIAIEPNLGRVFAYLNDHSGRGYVTEELVARLFGHGYCLALSAASSLKVWGLVAENPAGNGEPARLECDPYLRNWLLGKDELDGALAGIARILTCPEPLANWPVEEMAARIARLLDHPAPSRLRLFVAGTEGSGRRTFCACVSAYLGLSLLAIDSDRIPEASWAATFMCAQRYAYLNRCAPAWYGIAVHDRPWPPQVPAFQVQFITGEVDEFLQPAEGFLDLRVELPSLSTEQRRRLWRQLLPDSAKWPEEDFDALVRRRQATIGQIIASAAGNVQSAAEAAEAISAASRRRLGKLAQQLTGKFHWDDLVVSEWLRRGLEDFTFEATERVALWEQPEAQRLFPQGRGLLALFTGPPGTGKTMAAQVISNTLQLDLYRVDLSTIVSKYVGETSKNIERILSRAQCMDAILLFNEADALFGKRTDIKDAHDRFANTDTNYLLQAIEQYPGIAILASNRKANIDNGFTRRLRFVLDFPKPDAAQRLQLWQRIVAELAGAERAAALDKDLARLAGMMEITGAQIKYAVLSAVYLARREKTDIALAHLLRGMERELMKEGRGLGRQAQEMLKR